ncbi:Ethanolamine-phosphate phospho-lyase, partial [Fragariocoptes setiger]
SEGQGSSFYDATYCTKPSNESRKSINVALNSVLIMAHAFDTLSASSLDSGVEMSPNQIGSNNKQQQQQQHRNNNPQPLQSMSKEQTLCMRKKHVGPSVTLFFKNDPIKMVQGVGQYLYDEQGQQYLDCINNVAHVGHGNKHVQATVSRQLALLNTNSRFLHDNLALYAQRITSYFPAQLSVCYLVNSGSEANDLAMRLARAHTGHKDIICLEGAYHGNITSTMSISPYKNDHLINYKPKKSVHVAPLPCSYRGKFNRDEFNDDEIGRLYAKSVDNIIDEAHSNGRNIAAMFIESMVSCGGQTPLPNNYLRSVSRYLKDNGILMVCDEVQTGFGRTGKKMWAFQLDGDDIVPDIVTIGKPMGNGFPVSAVITTADIADSFHRIGTEYFNTYGGNAASCAAAMAVLDELENRQLQRNADLVGTHMLAQLQRIKSTSLIIGDVRGIGFFIGIDIVENNHCESKTPAPELATMLVYRFRDEHILMSTEGKFGNVLKFKPPMTFNMDDAARFLDVFVKALTDIELSLTHTSSSSSSSSSSASSVSSYSWAESSVEL